MKLILAVLMICAAASPLCASAKSRMLLGINHDFVWTDDKDIPRLIQAMKDAHVQSVRIGIRWVTVEPERGKWNFDKVDRVVKQIREAKIDILCTLMSVPAWASGVDPKEVKGFWDCYAPKDMADWEEYVRRVVTRYKGDIHHWEIWNEENGEDFYKPVPDAKVYVSILKSSYATIKKTDPRATVVLGGLQMNGIIANPWSPVKVTDFLQRIYDAGGKPYFDVVNVHPYVLSTPNEGPAYCAKLVRGTVEVMRKNGDASKPLWITETGLPTNSTVNEQMQAEHLNGIYRELSSIPEVKALFWFELRDYPKAICGGEESMGIVATDGRRKPSFDAFEKLAR